MPIFKKKLVSGLQATPGSVMHARMFKRTDGINLPGPQAEFTGQNLEDTKAQREIKRG